MSVYVKEMKIVTNNGSSSVFIESNEIKYVRVDNNDNIVIIFQNPKRVRDKTVIGYRSKLIGDVTGAEPGVGLKVCHAYEEEMKDEEKIVREGMFTMRDLI